MKLSAYFHRSYALLAFELVYIPADGPDDELPWADDGSPAELYLRLGLFRRGFHLSITFP